MTALGFLSCLTLLATDFKNNTTRSALIPPEVELAQAHWKVKNNRTNCARDGHIELSVVANPVEVPIEMT
jgi:hypothetical protein